MATRELECSLAAPAYFSTRARKMPVQLGQLDHRHEGLRTPPIIVAHQPRSGRIGFQMNTASCRLERPFSHDPNRLPDRAGREIAKTLNQARSRLVPARDE